jgi:hypothetical protein
MEPRNTSDFAPARAALVGAAAVHTFGPDSKQILPRLATSAAKPLIVVDYNAARRGAGITFSLSTHASMASSWEANRSMSSRVI